jgi:hypothetical protein
MISLNVQISYMSVFCILSNIRDISIRIRIRGYEWLVTDPDPRIRMTGYGSGSCSFLQLLSDANKICLLIYNCRYIYISLQRQQVIKKPQNGRNQGFSKFFQVFYSLICLLIRIRINNYRSRSGSKRGLKNSDSDPLVTTITYNTTDLFAFLRRKAALVKICYLTFFTNCKIKFKYVSIIRKSTGQTFFLNQFGYSLLYGQRFRTKCFWK